MKINYNEIYQKQGVVRRHLTDELPSYFTVYTYYVVIRASA